MPTVGLFNKEANKVGDIELNENIFAVEVNESAMHQVVVALLANKRQGTQSAKTRAEVRGGGIKPWRQKGTGRARQGSIRSPQWTGGGVVFAPKPRDFSQKINKTAKRVALVSALSAKLSDGNMIVVDKIQLENAKTKEMAAVMKALGVEKRALLVVTDEDAAVVRAARNIPDVTTIASELINVYDVVANEKFIATQAAVKKIEEAYKA